MDMMFFSLLGFSFMQPIDTVDSIDSAIPRSHRDAVRTVLAVLHLLIGVSMAGLLVYNQYVLSSTVNLVIIVLSAIDTTTKGYIVRLAAKNAARETPL